MKNNIKRMAVIGTGLALSGVSAFATDTAPLDLTATGTTIAGYVAAAALAGVAIMAAKYGVRVIVSAFKSVR